MKYIQLTVNQKIKYHKSFNVNAIIRFEGQLVKETHCYYYIYLEKESDYLKVNKNTVMAVNIYDKD